MVQIKQNKWIRVKMLRPHLILTLVTSIFSASMLSDGLNIRLVNGFDRCSGDLEHTAAVIVKMLVLSAQA
ncbi:hypothetical protein SRHO_G00194400 [Serrasalmus rhombeus]